jgi:hypothetical protein
VDNKLEKIIETMENQSVANNRRLDTLIESLNNQSRVANERLDTLIESLNNQSRAANEKLDTLIESSNNRSLAANEKLDKSIQRTQVEDPLGVWLDEVCLHAKSEREAARVLDRVLQDVIQPHHQGLFWGDRMLLLDRAAEFRSDPKFQAALTSANSSTGQNQYASPDGISWRYNTLIWAARHCP